MKIALKILSVFLLIVGSALIVASLATFVFINFHSLPRAPQIKAYAVMSGSMASTMPLGSLAIIAPAKNYLWGDVISFSPDNDPKDVITHRIAAKLYPEGINNPPVYLTAGDANKTIDQNRVKNNQIIGKLLIAIPYLGYVAAFLKHPYGFVLFVIIPATIIVWEEMKNIKKELAALLKKFSPHRDRESNLPRVSIMLPIVAAVLALTSVSASYFSDRETSGANSFVAGVWVTPSPTATPTPTPFPTTTPTPTPSPANHIVFSEIQIVGGATDDEFIELYNPTSSPIDISAWSIQYRGGDADSYGKKKFANGDSIPTHGFFLIAHGSYDGTVTKNLTHNFSMSHVGGTVFLVNNDITLTSLTDNGLTVVDKVAYGTGDNLRPETAGFTPAPLAHQSVERKAYSSSDTSTMTSGSDVNKGNSYDSNNNSFDFILRAVSDPQNTGSLTETP